MTQNIELNQAFVIILISFKIMSMFIIIHNEKLQKCNSVSCWIKLNWPNFNADFILFIDNWTLSLGMKIVSRLISHTTNLKAQRKITQSFL